MKKSFIKLQEDKVKLMREDAEIQKQVEKLGIDLQGLRESRANLESTDSSLNTKVDDIIPFISPS